jgi:hypothetical protein
LQAAAVDPIGDADTLGEGFAAHFTIKSRRRPPDYIVRNRLAAGNRRESGMRGIEPELWRS